MSRTGSSRCVWTLRSTTEAAHDSRQRRGKYLRRAWQSAGKISAMRAAVPRGVVESFIQRNADDGRRCVFPLARNGDGCIGIGTAAAAGAGDADGFSPDVRTILAIAYRRQCVAQAGLPAGGSRWIFWHAGVVRVRAPDGFHHEEMSPAHSAARASDWAQARRRGPTRRRDCAPKAWGGSHLHDDFIRDHAGAVGSHPPSHIPRSRPDVLRVSLAPLTSRSSDASRQRSRRIGRAHSLRRQHGIDG